MITLFGARSTNSTKIKKKDTIAISNAGLISGDGTLQDYFIQITDQYKENLKFVKTLFEKEFKIPITLRKINDRKYVIEISSKLLVDYFAEILKVQRKTKINQEVPEIITNNKDRIKFSYIKGWMDAEANIERWNKTQDRWYVRINFKVKDKRIVEWMSKELKKIKIKNNVRQQKDGCYRMQIASQKAVLYYYKIIGFSYPRKREYLSKLLEELGLTT